MARSSLLLVPAVALAAAITAPAGATAADVPTCLGVPATIVGTAGDDDLIGTDGPDVIAAGGGVDHVWARGGDDIVCLSGPTDRIVYAPVPEGEMLERTFERAEGGAGNDRMVGSRGPGTVLAGYGADEIWMISDARAMEDEGFVDLFHGAIARGGPGDDVLHGNDAMDLLAGGLGDDVITSEGAFSPYVHDALIGGPGDDRILAGPSDDILYGSRGSDVLDGGAGDDEIRADNRWHGTDAGMFGDDVLIGGPGADGLYGGGGHNTSDGGTGFDECMLPGPGEGATDCERLGSYAGQH